SMAPATAEAIRKALLQFKKDTGKFIISYGDNYSQNDYYIASVSDKMMINPKGVLEWIGLTGKVFYYKDLLDKAGIHFQIFKVGTYKSAVEPYIMNEMSDANKEQINSYLSDIWQQMLSNVSHSRHIPIDSLNTYANRGVLVEEGEDLIKLKLIDQTAYSEDVSKEIKRLMKLDEDDEYHTLHLEEMANVQNKPNKFKEGEIAVYYAVGEIQSASVYTTDAVIDQKKVCRDLRSLREDDNVKAVVLRVNSPGGSAFDSEQIWKDVVELKEKKPVVVSMGDYAASGGYYISCSASYIFAEPTTLTGSIGIFGMVPEAGELLDNKLGLHLQTVKTNEYSDFGSLNRPMNAGEQALMQKSIDRGYELFTKRCADGRKMQQNDIKAIAEGRVWTGKQAIQNGLVDELGGLNEAIAKAKELAKVTDTATSYYPAKPSLFDALLEQVSGDSYIDGKLKKQFGEYYTGFNLLRCLDRTDYIQARLPYILK
ncbi:MAG: signal peptide peptidase SppA, partial [Bacteroidaceae bacterium]|nr:signal peptide peptidase SppA [Bacteroidaceae bacterium]